MLRIEGVLYLDRDVLDANRIDGWRIDNLGTEVAQLHGLDIAQLIDGIGCLDDTGVGRHKAIDVGPYLQDLRIEGCSNDGCCIVRAATTEVGGLARILVATDEAGHHGYLRQLLEGLMNKLVGEVGHQTVSAILILSTNKVAAVHALATLKQAGNDI